MARIRTFKPDIWTDDKFVPMSPFARLFFLGMMNHADDLGRLTYNPSQLKWQILPADDVDPVALLEEITRPRDDGKSLARLYTVNGEKFLAMNFAKHQRIDKPTPSKLPPPPEEIASGDGVLAEIDRTICRVCLKTEEERRKLLESSASPPGDFQEPPRELATEGKGREGIEEGKGKGSAHPARIDSELYASDIPEGLDPAQYARGLLELLGLPTSRSILELVASAITTLAKGSSISNTEAAERIRRRAFKDRDGGETINRWWFEDARYNATEGTAKRGTKKNKTRDAIARGLSRDDGSDVAD